MAMKHIRLRVHAGRIEPEEPVELPEGTTLDATVIEPDKAQAARPRPLRTRALGVVQPLTKNAIYEDV